MFNKFIRLNVQICDWIEHWLPRSFRPPLKAMHQDLVAEHMNSAANAVVVDVGGGHYCPFAEHRDSSMAARIIAADISTAQLRRNTMVDDAVACDACRALPFKDNSVDLLVTRTLMEHLADNEAFLSETLRVLRPGGRVLHVFPGRYAPFAVLNRALPHRVVVAVLFAIFPRWRDHCGFRAYYTNCYVPRMPAIMEDQGYEIELIKLRYYQSIYFKFFAPLYVLSLAYDLMMWGVGWKPAASQILLVGRKPGGEARSRPEDRAIGSAAPTKSAEMEKAGTG